MLRLLNWQGIAGLGISLALLAMLTVEKLQAVHWEKSGEIQQRLQQEQAAFAATVANVRAAADQARAADQANAARLAAEQQSISQRISDDYESRLSAARARADELRRTVPAAADPRPGGNAPMPGIPATSIGAAQAAGEGRLPPADALTATEQAIQLDELIKWVKAQAALDPNNASTD